MSNKLIDINDRKKLNEILLQLKDNANPKWGVMKAQNMIEHLAKVITYTNGKNQAVLRVTEEEAALNKEKILNSDAELSKGIKSPLAGENADPFVHANLNESIKALNNELDDFETFHKNNPDAKFIQPRLGALDKQDWIRFHGKHFTHHFKQFGLF